jgi:ABC-type oligopeptide transport system ATPase subunit
MKLLGGSIPVIPNIYLDTSKVQENLKLLIGKKAAEILTSILESFNPSSMKKMVSFLKIRIIFHVTIRYPLNIFKRFIPWVINEIRPYVNRTAPIIALVGPDGTGKSTIAKQIINYTPDFFTGLIIRHSRPRLLPDPHELFFLESNNKKIETKPNRKRGNFHFIRLTYYAIDYFLGNFLLDCFDSSRLKIVVYDRCALDMFVDPLRYALKSNMGVMFIWRLLPKPDRIIFLHNDSVLIYKRKQELSLSEIQKQNELWLDLKDKGLVNNVITADNKNNILLEINQIIIDAFLEKNNYIEA